MGSVCLGDFTHSIPTHSSQTSFPPPASSEDGRGRVSCTPFPGTEGWPSAPAPSPPLRHGGKVASSAADPSQRGESLPRPGPFNRPRALGSHRHKARRGPPLQRGAAILLPPKTLSLPSQPITPSAPIPHCWSALPGPPCAQITEASGMLARSTGSAPKVHCVTDAAPPRHNLESRVPPIPG